MKLLDTSKELLITPFNHGVKLIKPSVQAPPDNLICVGDTLDLPINIYFLNTDSIIQNINDTTLASCNYPSAKDTIGKSVRIAAKSEIAKKLIDDDLNVIKSKEMKIYEENFVRLDELYFSAISFKFPWFDDRNQIIGVFGCSIVLGKSSLSEALHYIIKAGLLNTSAITSPQNFIPGREIKGIYVSIRELECIKLLIRGKTIKMIAKTLLLSPRTVEGYLENIKRKFGVHSKSDLIDKILS